MIYDILYNTLIDAKLLSISNSKVDRLLETGGTNYLVLIGSDNNATILGLDILYASKSDIPHIFSHNYTKVKIDSNVDHDVINVYGHWTGKVKILLLIQYILRKMFASVN